MDRKTVDAMTADEVRVAVAKAQGWRVKLLDEKQHFSQIGQGYYDGVIREYVLLSPKNQPIAKMRSNKLDSFLVYLPDLSDPREYMALMNKIWKKDKTVAMCGMDVIYNGDSECYSNIPYGGDYKVKELWEAIARAWLIICAGD